jgi:arsenite/tail-anchored protein-transporting ATPase
MTRRLSFFGGKGGVGKTTLATSFALLLAGRGARTLLVSTDPAHSTSDILGVRLRDEPVLVDRDFWAVEIDPAAAAAAHIERIKADAREAVSAEILPAVDQQLELAALSPGIEESALFDRFIDLIARCPTAYDRVVFDTAPTGHTLRLLTLPTLLTAWLENIIRQRKKVAGLESMLRGLIGQAETPPDDPLLRRLRTHRDKLHHARHRLLDDALFYVVLIPERLAVEETTRTLKALTDHGIDVPAVIVNRTLPPEADGVYLRARVEQQRCYLQEIARRFQDRPIIRIEQCARDISERGQLRQLAAHLAQAGLADRG